MTSLAPHERLPEILVVPQPGESQGRGSLVGCRLWGHTELDRTEATSQQQQQQRCILPHCGQILYQLSHKEAQEYWSG